LNLAQAAAGSRRGSAAGRAADGQAAGRPRGGDLGLEQGGHHLPVLVALFIRMFFGPKPAVLINRNTQVVSLLRELAQPKRLSSSGS